MTSTTTTATRTTESWWEMESLNIIGEWMQWVGKWRTEESAEASMAPLQKRGVFRLVKVTVTREAR